MPNTRIQDWLDKMNPHDKTRFEEFLGRAGLLDPSRPLNRDMNDPFGYEDIPTPPPTDRNPRGDTPPVTAPPPPATTPPATGGEQPPEGPRSIFSYAGGGGGFGGWDGAGVSTGGGGGAPGGGRGGYGTQLANELMARGGQLGQLDEATQQQLAKMKDAELLALQKTMGEQSASLLENLFGRGIQRSTVAGRAGEQLVASQGIASAQVEAQAAQRELALRQDISNRALEEAAVAAKDIDSLRGYEVGMAGVAAENARTSAQMRIAAMETQAKMAIAQGQLDLGYSELSVDKDRLKLQEDVFGFEQTQFWENLKRTDRQLDISYEAMKNDKRNGWLSFFGGLGAGLIEAIPFLSHPAFKEDMTELSAADYTQALSDVKALPIYMFRYVGQDKVHVGLNAVQARAINPLLGDGITVSPMDTIFTLMAAVKALAARVEELENARQ